MFPPRFACRRATVATRRCSAPYCRSQGGGASTTTCPKWKGTTRSVPTRCCFGRARERSFSASRPTRPSRVGTKSVCSTWSPARLP
ncbi:MAG: CxxxxCH/CxxCH domain-containing protein [Pseudomonadales bacterium]|nr:CxxxxCH/CxxCH domain-containing protein [Pseudomonadales bacterium]